jgi:hypothetical protein
MIIFALSLKKNKFLLIRYPRKKDKYKNSDWTTINAVPALELKRRTNFRKIG